MRLLEKRALGMKNAICYDPKGDGHGRCRELKRVKLSLPIKFQVIFYMSVYSRFIGKF